MADLIPLRKKLAKCIRLLNSNQDGEVAAAMEALKRTLKSGDADLNDLADYIVEPQLTEEQMKKIYDTAVIAVEQKLSAPDGHGPLGFNGGLPNPEVMATFCMEHIDDVHRDNARDFIRSVYRQVVIQQREPTPRQGPWLKDLYIQLGGRICARRYRTHSATRGRASRFSPVIQTTRRRVACVGFMPPPPTRIKFERGGSNIIPSR